MRNQADIAGIGHVIIQVYTGAFPLLALKRQTQCEEWWCPERSIEVGISGGLYRPSCRNIIYDLIIGNIEIKIGRNKPEG